MGEKTDEGPEVASRTTQVVSGQGVVSFLSSMFSCVGTGRVGEAVASELSEDRKILGKHILGRGNGNCKCP